MRRPPFSPLGNCYDADWLSNRVRKITPAGVVTTLAGGGGGTGTTAGMVYATGTTALFNQPAGLGIDSNDVLYVSTNTYCLITAITPAGVTSFFAGGGGASGTSAQCGTADGAAASASFQNPVWISLDSTNTFYVGALSLRPVPLCVRSVCATPTPHPSLFLHPLQLTEAATESGKSRRRAS